MLYNIIRVKESRQPMDLDDLEHIVIIGYTLWKWKTDYDEKQKKRIKAKPTKQKTKKRFKK